MSLNLPDFSPTPTGELATPASSEEGWLDGFAATGSPRSSSAAAGTRLVTMSISAIPGALLTTRAAMLLSLVALGCSEQHVAPGGASKVAESTMTSKHMPPASTIEPAPLTEEEQRVIAYKGTERPFTGKFVDHHEDGAYTCRRCGTPLFVSSTKFDSGSGWPSFDDAIPDAVKEIPDADGMRTEIVCARCGAHLGHVFRGERLTEKDTRHCVNSISLQFQPRATVQQTAVAYFAGGCFWGVEYYLEKLKGVASVESGYMGGKEAHPTYEEVCAKTTGHAETVKVVYDPSLVSYEALAKLFFEIHDPTQLDRQGPDVGKQYRSAVFVSSDREREIVGQLIAKLEAKGFNVVTEVANAAEFWPAESYHQDYYSRTGKAPYCHAKVKRFE